MAGDAVERFVQGLQAGDLDALAGTLAPQVVLNSPITFRARFQGAEAVTELYRAVLAAVTDIRVAEVARGDGVRVLRGSGVSGGRTLDETTVLRLDGEGRIAEITLFVRDLAALGALTAALGPRVARQHGAWRAPVVAFLTRPLALLTAFGDRIAARLAGIGER